MEMDNLLVAIDLGSNSFRLSIGRIVQHNGIHQIYSIDRLKETVRLAAGLDENRILSDEAIERAIHVLQRFGERIHDFPAQRVRAVATNTFRIAKNINQLLPLAEKALGFPIEVISGQEEARLVFSGVIHELPPSSTDRLVVDIGGGSTEFIIGKGLEPKLIKSLHMGCVSYTKAYFPKGKVNADSFANAELAASKELETISKSYRKIGWNEAFGSSGTAKALVAVLQDSGFSKTGITLHGMLKLKQVLIRHGSANTPELHGLKTDRMEVLPAGLAIMISIFKHLKVDTMLQGEGALRVGVLYDMLGRHEASDKRDETVQLFMRRYHIDTKQANRVKNFALYLYDCINPENKKDIRRFLAWAADLHEIGLSISQSSYHKHTAYVLEHADMPGFSSVDQSRLANLALMHHGRLNANYIQTLTTDKWQAILCLRLATVFLRKRQPLRVEGLAIIAHKQHISLSIHKKWLDEHPLTLYSLQLEAKEWENAHFEFSIEKV